LFGEITILSQILVKKYKPNEALNSWTGPSKSLDFSTVNSFVEVKTSLGENLINTTDSQINSNHEKQLILSFLKLKKDESGSNLNELKNLQIVMRKMLKENGAPPEGKWSDLRVLEPVRDYKGRHSSVMLTFDAVVDCINQFEIKEVSKKNKVN